MPRMSRLLACLGAALLVACSHDPMHDTEAAIASANTTARHGFGPEISAEDFAAHVKVLASDEFAGRAPGSVGEEKTVEYLRGQFQRLGLQPGNGDSYFQTVPMVETEVDHGASRVALAAGGKALAPVLGENMVLGTRRAQAQVQVDSSPLVFVGYGVNAPEQGWNDYAGLDVHGKTVVMLVNDPGFHAGDASLFEGRRMTYYGRWTYKFEEAARQGAAAALIIHDTAGAGYGWEVVRNSWGGPQFGLRQADDPAPRLPAQGWIDATLASALFAAAGQDLDALRVAAGKRGFKAVPLGDARLDVDLTSHIREAQSRNVVARLPGTTHAGEAVVYSAHWDHLGTHPDEPGDNIYNGAIDNATGVAGVLEIAESFTVRKSPPERSVVFLLVTLEESGLLGSQYYAAHPVVPLAQTVAVVNLDALPVVGPTRDFVVVGLGNNELEDVLRPIAAKQGRVLVAESEPERGSFFRSDHFNFAKAGVPALYAKGGIDHLEGGVAQGKAMLDDYVTHRYHKAADNYDPDWDLRGVVKDLQALYMVGDALVNSRDWPNYREVSEFRAVRDASRKDRQP
ncbi:MAG: M28 family metallopeptidase [Arenimonas sp.]